ncbi:malonic semialdehyde reductase [Rhizobium leguminosarum]|uniref:malonic semialdehyde reductase n=1 Tax=Rhizobium leguminosarum TaxID=384 RepID=UPI001C927A88|nr:malonic semialdehyde reductase [Rhizobium leguminosarum]MBY2907716.1 malonic semialdehyde reductase [Rhizobium leguminosarum]
MLESLDQQALDQLFRTARTYHDWQDMPVSDESLRSLYDLFRWGPTSANTNPARFVWVRSSEGKARLAAEAAEMNRPKILAAPVTVIVGQDLAFADMLPNLAPPERVEKLQSYFAQDGIAESTAIRNSSLQAAYLIIAARALGLDCGPMSGFSHEGVDAAFFNGTRIRSNLICSLGYGKTESLYPRSPRLAFEEANTFR